MHMRKNIFTIAFLLFVHHSFSQTIDTVDVLIRGGKIIDPKNNINAVMDLAIRSGKIIRVGKNIEASFVKKVVEAKGLIVAPGLIDIHGHVFHGTQPDNYPVSYKLLTRPKKREDYTSVGHVTRKIIK